MAERKFKFTKPDRAMNPSLRDKGDEDEDTPLARLRRDAEDKVSKSRAYQRYAPKAATREKRTTDFIDPSGIITKGVRP